MFRTVLGKYTTLEDNHYQNKRVLIKCPEGDTKIPLCDEVMHFEHSYLCNSMSNFKIISKA